MNNDVAAIQEILQICIELATTGGKTAHLGRQGGLNKVDTKTSPTDIVTEFDHATEEFIVDQIRKRRPNDSILGEESGSHPGASQYTWCIDPIDGTTNFYYGIAGWSVSIGVSDSSGAVVGVVYIPGLDELFTATRGGGAFLNGKKISCNQIGDISQALVCTGFSYSPDQRTKQASRVARFIHQIRDIRRFGAASIDICFVACGRLDAYFEENLHPWDIVAGELIATEAGARSGNYSGGASSPQEIMVTCPDIFEALSTLITTNTQPAN